MRHIPLCGKTTVELCVCFCDFAFDDGKGEHKWGHIDNMKTVKCFTSIKINRKLNLFDLIWFDLVLPNKAPPSAITLDLMVSDRPYWSIVIKRKHIFILLVKSNLITLSRIRMPCLFQMNVLQIDVLTKLLLRCCLPLYFNPKVSQLLR